MPTRPYAPLVLILGLILAATLDCRGVEADRKTQPGQAEPTLELKNGNLSFASNGATRNLGQKSALPYRIVCSSSAYSLATTCGSDLGVVTYSTDGSDVRAFRDMLVMVVQPPACVLAGLADSEDGGGAGVVLLGSRGEEVWRDRRADLLWPVTGEARSDVFCISQGSDANPLGVYGLKPTLERVAMPSGNEIWRRTFDVNEYVEDATIYGLGSRYGVICLQYGVDLYEFLAFELATGAAKSVKVLEGVPAYTSFYPGPIPEPAGVVLHGDSLSVAVSDLNGRWFKLVFDLAAGTLEQLPVPAQPGLGERNPHREGGRGIPAPPLFPQKVLPTQYGDTWIIPALVNEHGQVFIAAADGASWVAP